MKETWQQLKRLRVFFNRKDKFKLILLFTQMIIGGLLDVVGIGAVPAFIAALAMPEQLFKYAFIADTLNALDISPGKELAIWGSVVMLGIFVVKNVYLSWVMYDQTHFAERLYVRIAERLFRAYMFAPYTFHLNRNSAELIRNNWGHTRDMVKGLILSVINTAMGVFMTLFTLVLLLVATPFIALMGFAVIGGASALFFRYIRKILETNGERGSEERKNIIMSIQQGLGALIDARMLRREGYFIRLLRQSVSNFAGIEREQQVIFKIQPYLLETISVAGMLLVLIGLVLTGMDILALVPTLALFAVAVVRLRQTVAKIVEGLSQIQYNLPLMDKVMSDLEELEPIIKAQAPRMVSELTFERSILIDKISYTYPGSDEPVLRDIELAINKGESIAFVGSTGSGKSTLVNIILGLLTPDQGKVLVDGLDIHENLPGWLRHVGYIPQTIYLLDTTIRGNVAFALTDDEIDDKQVWAALEAAQLADYVRSLPDRLDTMVGERGVRLSGGQRQRLGLARALFNNPDILIMDEATSALDNQTESKIMEALDNLKAGRTFIIIAHRLKTVQKCDRLYFLKNGRIEGVGSFDELLEIHAEFQKMANLKQSI